MIELIVLFPYLTWVFIAVIFFVINVVLAIKMGAIDIELEGFILILAISIFFPLSVILWIILFFTRNNY